MDGNMARRVGFAAVAIPVVVGLTWLGGWPLALLVAAASALGTRELYDLAERAGLRPWRPVGIAAATACGPATWLVLSDPAHAARADVAWPYALAIFVLLVLLGTLVRLGPGDKPLASAAATLVGPLYTGLLPAFLLDLRHGGGLGARSWAGVALVFYPLVVTWICDSAAMFAGQRLGGRKLWPSVSPGKTWSGSTAGLVAALLVAPLYQRLVLQPAGLDVPLLPLLVVAALVGVLGQLGDLVESLFKREVGVKDSSSLIPGHGGVLDRLDSLYVVVPLAAACFRWLGVP